MKENVWMINHTLAEKIISIPDGYHVVKPIVSFVGTDSINKAESLDQLVFNKGRYRLEVNIVEVATGNMVAQAELDNEMVLAPHDGYTHGIIGRWKYYVLRPGFYRYQIYANGICVASFVLIQQERDLAS